jgi:hypothetical protein
MFIKAEISKLHNAVAAANARIGSLEGQLGTCNADKNQLIEALRRMHQEVSYYN